MTRHQLAIVASLVLVCASAAPRPAHAQSVEDPISEGPLEVLKVQGNVWLIAGAGANIAVQAGDQGIVVVDSGTAAMSGQVMAAIRRISSRPIRYIINTSSSPQHTGGNAVLATASTSGARGGGAIPNIVAQENVYTRMAREGPDGKPRSSADGWPNDSYFAPRRKLIFNGEAIDIIHMPHAYSDGDSIVYFRGSNVLVTGDIFTTTNLPMVNPAEGGTYAGLLTALRSLLDIAAPDDLMEAGTYIIPGHGRVCDDADLVEYHDMAYEIRDRVSKLVSQGKTLEEVKAAHPVLGWERRYSQPGWTADQFIEAIYPEFAPKIAAAAASGKKVSKK